MMGERGDFFTPLSCNFHIPQRPEETHKMQIETKRLILRELTESDDDALYRVLDDSDIRGTRPIRSTKRASTAGFAATSRAIKYSASACGRSAAKTPAR